MKIPEPAIYTSYFSNWRNFPADYEQICIARFRPRGFEGASRIELAPSVRMVKEYKAGDLSVADFTQEYINILGRVNWASVVPKLFGKILCCYEPSDEFCHRHILRHYLSPYTTIVEL